MSQEQEPTIGRIVHYVTDGVLNRHRPAIVIECNGSMVNLQVFTAEPITSGTMWVSEVLYDGDYKSEDTWHWPERNNDT